MVADLVQSYKAVGCYTFLKVHFLDTHLDFFPENLGVVSNEHREQFHQNLSTIEKRYKDKWNPSMLAEYCWIDRRDVPQAKYSSHPLLLVR